MDARIKSGHEPEFEARPCIPFGSLPGLTRQSKATRIDARHSLTCQPRLPAAIVTLMLTP